MVLHAVGGWASGGWSAAIRGILAALTLFPEAK
jgi:hypothetical protein